MLKGEKLKKKIIIEHFWGFKHTHTHTHTNQQSTVWPYGTLIHHIFKNVRQTFLFSYTPIINESNELNQSIIHLKLCQIKIKRIVLSVVN